MSVYTNDIETRINQSAVGLKTLEEIKNTHDKLLNDKLTTISKCPSIKCTAVKRDISKLSFDVDEDEVIPCKIFKNPDVEKQSQVHSRETTKVFSARRNEWIDEIVRIKDQDIAISYIYWNGSSYTKVHKTKKGSTIAEFLKRIWPDLHCEFTELINASPDDLLFVKDDIILLNNYSFFDLIVNKAMGKTGPLFNFDLLINEKAKLYSEKPEVPLAKVCLKSWYEKNRTKFPFDKWKLYEPEPLPDDQPQPELKKVD